MTEKLVSYQTALLAKEKGFEENCLHFYCENSTCNYIEEPYRYSFPVNANFKSEDNFGYGKTTSAPTLSLLQKWLREQHKIAVFVERASFGHYGYSIYPNINKSGEHQVIKSRGFTRMVNTYEEALEKGINEGLTLISV